MLTLILGPSGSGKSVRLREELRQRARSRQRSILIVPEQFTSSTEGALYHALGDELSAYVESYSFTSLAETLLRRYGVVFWRLLEREADWLPSWRELLRTFHRLEARGEIRGGRFVSGLAGEQFALPEAIALLREVRRRPHDGSLIAVCGVDPLNLAGTLLPGPKVPALASNRLVYRDGLPAAAEIAGQPHFWLELDQQAMAEVHGKLIRH